MKARDTARLVGPVAKTLIGLLSGKKTRVQLTENMGLDINGAAAAGIFAGAAALTKTVLPRSKAWLVPALAAIPVTAFFRDPERRIPADTDAIVASADGRVLSVETVVDERLGSDKWLRIAVFLSVLDVHINRAPVSGKVISIATTAGGYASAQTERAGHNVSSYTVLETPNGKVAVAQRTGLIARRIVNRSRVGKRLERGERYGLIRFGSRTDIYLPVGAANALVQPGDRVRGGETIVAEWR